MDIIGLVADLIGIGGAIFAFFAWLNTMRLKKGQDEEQARLKEEVEIVLQHGGHDYPLSTILRRGELTRAEVSGVLGMVPMVSTPDQKQARFNLPYLSTPKFWAQMRQILDGRGKGILTIPCTDNEIKQFDPAWLSQSIRR